ncbi:MAG: bifunctional folylpolyglutamate synthase/dihydrofolate synthase [Casimicrobiaceae bacterium]
MNLSAWIERIAGLRSGPEIVLGLERIRPVFEALGAHPRCPVFLVAGTNGKGSTVAFLDAILRAQGYRTARYTSPHLARFNERVVIDGQQVGDCDLVAAFERVEDAREAAGGPALTFFEYSTLAALSCFAEVELDAWVIEVGLGGRLDATNVLDADCAIITTIGLDHTEWLGPTREDIAREKAGILRAGRPAVIGEPDPPATLRSAVAALGVPARWIGRDFGWQRAIETPAQWRFWRREADGTVGGRPGLPLPALRGRFQLDNAAVALSALDVLSDRLPVSAGAIRSALVGIEWPARFQVLPGQPVTVLDVAHNPHAARVLAEALGEMPFYPCTHAVFSMLADKDLNEVVRIVAPRIDRWHVAALSGPRATPVDRLVRALIAAGVSADAVRCHASIEDAARGAQAAAVAADRIVVFGSFLTVSAARAVYAVSE